MTYKKMTEQQKEQLAKLLKQQEEDEKHDADFFKEVRARKAEVLEALNAVSADDAKEQTAQAVAEAKADATQSAAAERLERVAEAYGCSVSDLLDYIASEKQTNYYKNTHRQSPKQAQAEASVVTDAGEDDDPRFDFNIFSN